MGAPAQTTVSRLVIPRLEEFLAFARQGRPAIISGAMDTWKCRTHWTDEYLERRLAGRRLLVTTSTSGDFGLFSSRIRDTDSYVQVTWTELLTRMLTAEQSGRERTVHYMQQKTIQETFPELVEDLEYPQFLDPAAIRNVNLWLSQRRSNIPLHFDTFDNLLAQVRGTKSVTLYAPNQSSSLYPGRDGAEFASQIDMSAPDLEKFPRFRDSTAYARLVLAEGEMLYLPAFWWHHVVTDSDVSLSINYWYHLVYGHPRQSFLAVRDMVTLAAYYLNALPPGQKALAALWGYQQLHPMVPVSGPEGPP
jgi:hypothetical protein